MIQKFYTRTPRTVLSKAAARLGTVAAHRDRVIQRVDGAVVRLQILVARMQDPVVVVHRGVVQWVGRKNAVHRLNVVAASAVHAALGVAHVAVPLADGEPHNGMRRREMLLQPRLVCGRLGARGRVVPLDVT